MPDFATPEATETLRRMLDRCDDCDDTRVLSGVKPASGNAQLARPQVCHCVVSALVFYMVRVKALEVIGSNVTEGFAPDHDLARELARVCSLAATVRDEGNGYATILIQRVRVTAALEMLRRLPEAPQ